MPFVCVNSEWDRIRVGGWFCVRVNSSFCLDLPTPTTDHCMGSAGVAKLESSSLCTVPFYIYPSTPGPMEGLDPTPRVGSFPTNSDRF